MVILPLNILSVITQFVLLAIDASIMLVIVRVLRRWRPNSLLVAIDNAGAPLVNWLTTKANALCGKMQNRRQLSVRGQLALVLVLLMALRLMVISAFCAMK